MAPEFGGIVPPGHSQRVAALVGRDGRRSLGVSAERHLRSRDGRAAAPPRAGHDRRARGSVRGRSPPSEVAAVTSAMLREIKPLAAAGDIVAGDAAEPRRRVAVQVLRVASDYDDLTARDGNASERRDRDAAIGARLRLRREGAHGARAGRRTACSSRPRAGSVARRDSRSSASVDADAGLEAHRRGLGPAGGDEHELHRVAGDLASAGAHVVTGNAVEGERRRAPTPGGQLAGEVLDARGDAAAPVRRAGRARRGCRRRARRRRTRA